MQEKHQLDKQLKVMQERITQTNKSPKKASPAKSIKNAPTAPEVDKVNRVAKSKKSTSTEVQIGSSMNHRSNPSNRDTGADIMHLMHKGNCGDVIN